MIWAYYRVSTGKQDIDCQKLGVLEYAHKMGYKIDKEIIDDGVSGTVVAKKRNLWKIVKESKEGDWVIVPELSRLGRSTIDVLETCRIFGDKKVNVWFVKQGMGLDQSPMGKMILAILSAFSEMERDLIRQRTVEGLARARQRGKVLGRPFGKKNLYYKLGNDADKIKQLFDTGMSYTQMANALCVSRRSLVEQLKRMGLYVSRCKEATRKAISAKRRKYGKE